MSRSKLKSIYYSIHEFMKPYKSELSHATFANRTKRLEAMFKELHQLGYEPTHIDRIKPKHIEILVKHWQAAGLSIGSIKNRMSDLRFICLELRRGNVIKANHEYQIGNRAYIPKHNKALVNPDFSGITDPNLRCSLELQKAFGLRREECIKIIPSKADEGNLLRLQASWTKGGIERAVPIRTPEQRFWLNEAKKIANDKSLIPKANTYIQQRNRYDELTRLTGFKNLHGVRHAYAQQRYVELTGWQAPIAGGKARNALTKSEYVKDQEARKMIAWELGHSRVAIAKNYLG